MNIQKKIDRLFLKIYKKYWRNLDIMWRMCILKEVIIPAEEKLQLFKDWWEFCEKSKVVK
jgi:hypothetical protein